MEFRQHYRDHSFAAWTEDAGDGHWTWVFTIDDSKRVQRHQPVQALEAAVLQEAINQARYQIENLPVPTPQA